MAIQFGPAFFSTIPGDASDVVVTTLGGSPVTLATPVSVDEEGRVSFAVAQPGVYSVLVRDSAGFGVTYTITLTGAGSGNVPGNGTIYDYIDRLSVSSIAGMRGDISAEALVEALDIATPSTPGGSTGIIPISTPCSRLATMADFGAGNLNIGYAGDSTMNDGQDWPRAFMKLYGNDTDPSLGIIERQWNSGTETYGSDITIKAGAATPDVGGPVLTDNFNRIASELVGSTTSGGQTWTGTAGTWSADGSVGRASGTAALMFDAGSKDMTNVAEMIINTSTDSVSPQTRVYAACTTSAPASSGNYVWAQLVVNTSGAASFSVWKRVGGTNTQIISTDNTTGIATNSATPQNVKIEISLAIQQVSAKLTVNDGTPKTYEGTVTESDYAALGTYAGYAMLNNAAGRHALDAATISVPLTPGVSSGIRIWNGAVAGSTLAYAQSRIASLYPEPLDILFICTGHNYGTMNGATFVAAVDDFIEAFQAVHPTTKILITSQNPQKSPSTTIAAHAARQAALRDYAAEKGFEYLPAYEMFASMPDGGSSFIMSDGIHPTSPPFNTLEDSGAVRWAQALLDQVNGFRKI